MKFFFVPFLIFGAKTSNRAELLLLFKVWKLFCKEGEELPSMIALKFNFVSKKEMRIFS